MTATTVALIDARGRLWLWDPGLLSWRHDDGKRTLLRDRSDLDKAGPLREPECPTCWDQRRIRDDVTALHPTTAPCPDCTDGVDEPPSGRRHADTVPVPGEVHVREAS